MKKKNSLKAASEKGDLVPYYLEGKNCPSLYNDVRAPDTYEVPTNFQPTGNAFGITGLPFEYVSSFFPWFEYILTGIALQKPIQVI